MNLLYYLHVGGAEYFAELLWAVAAETKKAGNSN